MDGAHFHLLPLLLSPAYRSGEDERDNRPLPLSNHRVCLRAASDPSAPMKITALLVRRYAGSGGDSFLGSSDPVVLANASDVSHFGYFQRTAAKEFIIFRPPHRRREDASRPAPVRPARRLSL